MEKGSGDSRGALRDGRWKMIHELDSGLLQLFDVTTDSAEKCALSGAMPERMAVYREHLQHWASAQTYRMTRK